MKRWVGPTWMAGGAVLGALVTAILLGAVPLPIGPKHSPLLQRLPTPILAQVLIAREARTIVQDRRDRDGLWDGASLFGRPDAASASLCRVRVYSFGNYSRMRDRARGGSAGVADWYGIWADPAYQSNRPAGAEDAGCAAYTDFDHLIWGDPHEIIPATHLVAAARRAATQGKADFSLSCLTRHPNRKRTSCDGVAYLRSLDLKKIQGVELIGDPMWRPESPRQFRVMIEDGQIHGPPLVTTLTVISRPGGSGMEPVVASVALERDAH